ncbi:MAG: hypothetical protein PVH87_24200 [Desulfobacteraceae bacterium]
MSHELFIYGMIDAGEFKIDGVYNAHHELNQNTISNLPTKKEIWENKKYGYVFRDIFHCVQPPSGFRSQVIHFGNSYKESTVELSGFIDDWLNEFEKVLNKLFAFGAIAHIETELGGSYKYEWVIAEGDNGLYDSPPTPPQYVRSGGKIKENG